VEDLPIAAVNLASLHPDPSARAPGLATRIRLPSGMARKASRYRAASEMAVVATPLITILPDGPYDQEIKSLLPYQLTTVERTGHEPANPGCSWVRIPLFPPNESAIGRLGRTSLFHGGNTLTARDGRLIPKRGFESHPLRPTDGEGFEPSQRRGHSPLKAVTALSEQRIFSPLLGDPADYRPYKAIVGIRIPSGTPPGARKSQ
jgi:hypothetical protein